MQTYVAATGNGLPSLRERMEHLRESGEMRALEQIQHNAILHAVYCKGLREVAAYVKKLQQANVDFYARDPQTNRTALSVLRDWAKSADYEVRGPAARALNVIYKAIPDDQPIFPLWRS